MKIPFKKYLTVPASVLLSYASPVLAQKTEPLVVNPKYGKIVRHCKDTQSSKAPHVYFIKQWHLSPEVNTFDAKPGKAYPQEKNQTAIYEQIKSWVEAKNLNTVVAEGCDGELSDTSTLKFNHWGVGELSKEKNSERYAKILSSVPLKIEVKFPQVHTVCGDDSKLIKENLLAFSDARGDLGYLTRLIENKSDARKTKIYLDGVIESFKLPANSTPAQALTALNKDFKESVERVEKGIDQRSIHAVDVVSDLKDQNVALIFGGMHAQGIVKSLEEKGLACDVIEPVGYQNDEEAILTQLQSAVKGLNSVVNQQK